MGRRRNDFGFTGKPAIRNAAFMPLRVRREEALGLSPRRPPCELKRAEARAPERGIHAASRSEGGSARLIPAPPFLRAEAG
jgi:hypothetical protein